jgi:hypothetical protein
MADALEETRVALERVQNFDTVALPRERDLGSELNFQEAVEPARRIIGLFQQFPVQYLSELPPNRQKELKGQADSFFNILDQIKRFDPKTPDAFGQRNGIINSLKNQYQSYFDSLFSLIAYGSSRLRDFGALEREARASMQSVTDRATELTEELSTRKQEADKILEEVRRVAAEQGVSQQAIYFQNESLGHAKEADSWRTATIWIAIGLVVYSVLSIFIHKWTWLQPTDAYSASQVVVSKVLIFAVIAYMLILSARNFLSHKHNEIVNRHRQNALLTSNALVNAAGKDEARDIVLTYAAACIFAPQETGYTKPGGSVASEVPTNIVQAVPKLVSGAPMHS